MKSTVSYVLCLGVALIIGSSMRAGSSPQTDRSQIQDVVASWGSDHVGMSFPDYLTGDECLFCHRKIGATWSENRHQLTIRPATSESASIRALHRIANGPKLAAETTYVLGSNRTIRFLKKSREYGMLEMLSAAYTPSRERQNGDRAGSKIMNHGLANDEPIKWEHETFSKKCAGCHTTAVSPPNGAFSALSLDCFVCHGDVTLAHTKNVNLVLLSQKNRNARQVVSICGQCHLRGGKSKSTGLPYPNTFVAGDNLFRDYQLNWSDTVVESLPAIEQHIVLNARDCASLKKDSVSCIACHSIHGGGTEKHLELKRQSICLSCHELDTNRLRLSVRASMQRVTHNRVCDY